ncbi:MAG: efflux RND transporter periplasmic adaptor subunit [Holophagales bacterium]|jgi:HlyD family secretion protein|nr:efflux RND transporter periplasmic adaptor subunit [Holophagales bacterium]
MKLNTLLFIGTAAILVVGGGGYWYFTRDTSEIKWRTAKVELGNLQKRVSATGTLSAIQQVDVGTQVSGMVMTLGADFNSIVKKDQVIATIDPTIPQQTVNQREIEVERLRINFEEAGKQLERYQNLAEKKLVSVSDLEGREVSYRTAKLQWENSLIQLDQARTNLGYCTIKSPVDGIVVSRKADVGQTVTASMTTPSLFIIAEDLSKMKLEITMDEMDIAEVEVGQIANFSVEAFRETQFQGEVAQVRLEPVTSQNVVNYKVVVEVSNKTKQQIEGENEMRRSMMSAFGGGRGPGGQSAEGQGQSAQGAEGQARPQQGRGGPDGQAARPERGNNGQARSSRGQQGSEPPQGSPNAERPNRQDRPDGQAREGRERREGREARGDQQPDGVPTRQGGDRQGNQGGGGRMMGGQGAFGPGGQPDWDRMWENAKDRILEREPGITKEAWIQRIKDMRAQMESGQQPMRFGPPDGSRAEGAAQQQAQPTTQARANSSTQRSSIIKAGGQFYQGDYVLRPGMTAMVTIVVKQARGVLSVPNTALRFNAAQYTKEAQAAALAQQKAQQAQQGGLLGGGGVMMFGPPQTQDRRARLADRGFATERTGRVWVLDEKGEPKALTVRPGLDSGNRTEITGEGIAEGMEVLIGVDETKKNGAVQAGAMTTLGGGNQMGGAGGGGGRR